MLTSEEQTLKKKLLESENNFELYKTECVMRVNDLEKSLNSVHAEVDSLNNKLMSEQSEKEKTKSVQVQRINDFNQQVGIQIIDSFVFSFCLIWS